MAGEVGQADFLRGSTGAIIGIKDRSSAFLFSTGAGTGATVRQVATRSRIPTNIGGGVTQSQTRSRHFAMASLTSFQVVYSNWYNSGSSDANVGSACNIECSVEYPVGTFTRITFAGVNQGTIADGANIISDPVAVTIPKGAEFFLRPYISGSINVPFCTLGVGPGGVFYDSANGERSEFGTSVTNRVMGGTIADMNAGLLLPSAIIAVSDRPAAGFIGDSRVAGIGDAYTGGKYSLIGEFERVFGKQAAFINIGISGEAGANFTTANRAKSRALINSYCTHVFADIGGDIRNGVAPATALTTMKAIRDQFPLLPFYLSTISPVTTSTDGWITTGNQTVTANEANRTTYNTSLLQGDDFAGIMNVAGVVEAAGGKWQPFYTVDGSHMNLIASQIFASSGLLDRGMLI